MNKSEHRHQLIRALITKNKIHTQAELQALLAENDIQVTQATLSRDIKNMNLSKVREEDSAYYVLNNGSISKWEKRLELYMEDALVWMRPVQHQVLLKTLPGLAQSFGSIIDTLSFLTLSLPFVVMMSVLSSVKMQILLKSALKN